MSYQPITADQVLGLSREEVEYHLKCMTEHTDKQTLQLEAKKQENFSLQKEIRLAEAMNAEIVERIHQPNPKLLDVQARLRRAAEAKRKAIKDRDAQKEELLEKIAEAEQRLENVRQRGAVVQKQLKQCQALEKNYNKDDVVKETNQLLIKMQQMNERYYQLVNEFENDPYSEEEKKLDEHIKGLKGEIKELECNIEAKRKDRERMREELNKLQQEIADTKNTQSTNVQRGNSMFAEIHDYCKVMRHKTKKAQDAVNKIMRDNVRKREEITRLQAENTRAMRSYRDADVTPAKFEYDNEMIEIQVEIEKLVKQLKEPAVFQKGNMPAAVKYVEDLYNTRQAKRVELLNNMAECAHDRLEILQKLWDTQQRARELHKTLNQKRYESSRLKIECEMACIQKNISFKCTCNEPKQQPLQETASTITTKPKAYKLNLQKLMASKATTLAGQIADSKVDD